MYGSHSSQTRKTQNKICRQNQQLKANTIKGFVLHLQKASEEDTIALVLSKEEIGSYYRFYGARHSILKLGHLIDFECDNSDGRYLPRLRSLSHMGFPWLFDPNRVLVWQNFIRLFKPHLQDAQTVDPFYFELLLACAKKWHKQNPKRLVCEAYLSLLAFEGRVYNQSRCYLCNQPTNDAISLIRGLKQVHPECVYSPTLDKKKFEHFLKLQKTLYLEESEVEIIYDVVMKGL